MIKLGESWVKDDAGCTLESGTDLTNALTESVLDTLIEHISSILCGGGYFNEFCVTFDGFPSFAEAKTIVICCVTKKWQVI